MNVGENEAGLLLLHQINRLAMGAGNTRDGVAEAFHDLAQVERNDGFVLDDHDVGRHLFGDGVSRLFNQHLYLIKVAVENDRHFFRRETLDRAEQHGFAGQRREAGQTLLRHGDPGRITRRRRRFQVDGDRLPPAAEQPVQRNARFGMYFQARRLLHHRFQHGGDISVTRLLAAG